MDRPDFRDAVYEAFFTGGYAMAFHSGALNKELYDKHEDFFRSMDQGAPLVAWCHFIDTYFGSRDMLIRQLEDAALAPIVKLLYYVRNAFIHCGWDISKLRFQNQRETIREFCDAGGTDTAVPVFKLTIDEDNCVHIGGLMGMCMKIADSLRSSVEGS
jgi:hypothetical protein